MPLSQLFETACLYGLRAPLSQSGRSLVRTPQHHLGQTGRAELYFYTSIVWIVLICETTALTCPELSVQFCTALVLAFFAYLQFDASNALCNKCERTWTYFHNTRSLMPTPTVVWSPTSASDGVGRCRPIIWATPSTRRVSLYTGEPYQLLLAEWTDAQLRLRRLAVAARLMLFQTQPGLREG